MTGGGGGDGASRVAGERSGSSGNIQNSPRWNSRNEMDEAAMRQLAMDEAAMRQLALDEAAMRQLALDEAAMR